jgi:valyl-tRNA synthetase
MSTAESPTAELSKQYDAAQVEQRVSERWRERRAFHAQPDARTERYVVMMPLPNVTGALHMGHAMDNVMQDLLVRWQRMRGANTLWMPGTDHAGIATQALVEKRLFELEGISRHDLGRERLVERIWQWKEQYQQRIVRQQQRMGCSCDWDRQRFTMDPVCTRAVRHAFFRLFDDGLLYRGHRLVNWDCHLQTAVSDDEIVREPVAGHFWHIRYAVIDPAPGEPAHVVVATTRPETLLGDTAVACHPEPGAVLDRLIEEARTRLAAARPREREALETELGALEQRRAQHLPLLERLAAMARAGRRLRLPLLGREIPLITDEWAKPELGSGCVKITPAHDPNDYEVWGRHPELGSINLLHPDGTLNEQAGPYAGLDRLVARERVAADLAALGALERVEERELELGYSDRSKTLIEPYLSTQWFVRMGDRPGGVRLGRGTPHEHGAAGLAQAAIDAALPGEPLGNGRDAQSAPALRFHPDPERYRNTFVQWLAEKRDWCVSRQLWWGHRIPVWIRAGASAAELEPLLHSLLEHPDASVCARLQGASGVRAQEPLAVRRDSLAALLVRAAAGERFELQVCLRDERADAELGAKLEHAGFARDPDVLDTWFSSGLWPHSTLGWPDPQTAEVGEGAPLGARGGAPDALAYYYPGSCLVTGRDIITLWVARMVILGLYNLGQLPFRDCFIHATILDGNGVRMSKSKGNGIDPVDIIERYGTDALRYVICELQTGSQDVRLPVQAISPFTGSPIDLASARHGRSIFTYVCPESGKEFDVLGTLPELPSATLVSDRFDVGRAFCTKLWNASRFVFMNLAGAQFTPRPLASLALEDRWLLARLARARAQVQRQLEAYNPSAAVGAAHEFFWSELCDWYLELAKPRLRDPAAAPAVQQVLAAALDQCLRLLHPFVPFITEELWSELGRAVPQRGIEAPLEPSELLVHAAWPAAHPEWQDEALERRMTVAQDLIREIRSVRSRHEVPPRQRIGARVRGSAEALRPLEGLESLVSHMAGLASLEIGTEAASGSAGRGAVSAVVGELSVELEGVIDVGKQRERLAKQREQLARAIEAAERKLASESFVTRAPAAVVQTERDRLAQSRAELEGVEVHLRALD